MKLGAPPSAVRTDNAEAVALACRLHQEGHSLQAIAEAVANAGHPTKRGGRWAPETVRQLLARHAQARVTSTRKRGPSACTPDTA